MRILRLATRHSPLAIKQSLAVKEALERTTPDLEIKLIKMKTQGDIITDKPLADIGGKGLFLKELQEAILNDLQTLMEELNEKRENIRNNILVSSEKARGSILTVERLEREKSKKIHSKTW